MNTEEVLFTNVTNLDAEKESKLTQKTAKKTIFLWSTLLFLVMAGAGAGLIFVNITLGVITIACGVLGGYVLLPYILKDGIKKGAQTKYGGQKYTYTYQFYSDRMEVSIVCDNNKDVIENEVVNYSDFLRVKVLTETVVVFTKQGMSFSFDFKAMKKGTIVDVLKFFKEKEINTIYCR